MVERMTPRELEIFAREGQQKFEYAMVGVTLTALALSFQFSPGHGHLSASLLLTGWMSLFVSAVLGGWRLMYAPAAFFLNVEVIEASAQNDKLRTTLNADQDSTFLHPETLKRLTSRQVSQNILNADIGITKSWGRLERFRWWALKLFNLQVCLLLVGFACVGLFTAINFWYGP